MDELAEQMGCKPHLEKYLFTDPKFALKLFFGGNFPYVYRLNGPHAWSGAREAILDSNRRISTGMSQRKVPPVDNTTPFLISFALFVFVIGLFVKIFL
jgi:dimethylaniline monooxygenase (N-oxide forming)